MQIKHVSITVELYYLSPCEQLLTLKIVNEDILWKHSDKGNLLLLYGITVIWHVFKSVKLL